MGRSLAPHDGLFIVLGGIAGVTLALSGSWLALEVLGGTALYTAVVAWLRASDDDLRERAALVLAYGFALWFYVGVERYVPARGAALWDATLLAADRALLGETPSVALQGLSAGALDLLSIAYFAYLPWLHWVCLWELAASRERARALGRRLFPAFAIGYLGYFFVPANGPGLAFPTLYDGSLGGGAITTANQVFMASGSPGFDVFPSLHLLITLVIWTHDWVHCRVRALVLLPVMLPLWVATLALRYHFAADLLAGVLVFAGVHLATRSLDTQRDS